MKQFPPWPEVHWQPTRRRAQWHSQPLPWKNHTKQLSEMLRMKIATNATSLLKIVLPQAHKILHPTSSQPEESPHIKQVSRKLRIETVLTCLHALTVLLVLGNRIAMMRPHVKLSRSPSDCQDPIWSKIDPLRLLWLHSNHPPRLQHYANQTPELRAPPETSNTLSSLSKNSERPPRTPITFLSSFIFIILF